MEFKIQNPNLLAEKAVNPMHEENKPFRTTNNFAPKQTSLHNGDDFLSATRPPAGPA